MNSVWTIVGAAGAFVSVYFVRERLGTFASVVAVAVLLLAWWSLHLYTHKRLDGLYRRFQQLDSEGKAQALSELDPEIRTEIEKRMTQEKNG